jgi:hypothetical protein
MAPVSGGPLTDPAKIQPTNSNNPMKSRLLPLISACVLPNAHGALVLTYDAADLSPGSAVGQSWDPTGTADDAGFTAGFASGTVAAATGSAYFSQTLSGANTAANSITSFQSLANNNDFSYELWIRPADLSGDHNLFETGGATIGTSLTISDNAIQFTVRENAVSNTVSSTLASLSGEFIQVLGVVVMGAANDNTTSDDTLTLYINGVSVDTNTFALGSTVGANAGHFGFNDTNIARPAGFANPHSNYDGELALARFYDTALDSTEVTAIFNAIPEPSVAILGAFGMLGLFRRRRQC